MNSVAATVSKVSDDSDAEVRLKIGERLAWAIGAFGSSFMWGTLGAFLLVFYTDVFGISPAAAGTLFLVARIVDGINDPITGYLIDHLPRTRWGRFRHILMIGVILAAANFVLIFAAPELPQIGKLIWAYVTYILFGFTIDFVSIPRSALLPTMTRNPQDRNALSSIGAIIGIVGYAVVALGTVYLVEAFATPLLGWRMTAAIYAVLSIALIGIMVLRVRERVEPVTKVRYKLWRAPGIVLRNKPLMILLAAFIFTSLAGSIIQPASVLFFKYAVGDEKHYGGVTGATTLVMVVSMAVFPLIVKRLGKRKAYILFGLITVVGGLWNWFLPYNSIALIYVASGVIALGMAGPLAINSSLIADTVDYTEWQSGVRAEGAVYAGLGFANKLVMGLAGAIPGYVLALVGYVPNAVQTERALRGMLFMRAILPAAFVLVSAILISFYPLTEQRFNEIVKEIRARRKESAAA